MVEHTCHTAAEGMILFGNAHLGAIQSTIRILLWTLHITVLVHFTLSHFLAGQI